MKNVFVLSLATILFSIQTAVAQYTIKQVGNMCIYAYQHELFSCTPPAEEVGILMTESFCYEQLCKHPITRPVNYLAVPWTYLIKHRLLDTFPHITISGGFTICRHFRYKEIIPILKKIGIDTIFTPHAPHKQWVDGIRICPLPFYPINGVNAAKKKNIFYSFVGSSATHRIRKKIFSLKHPANATIIRRSRWHFYHKNKESIAAYTKEYKSILAQSRYSLCPRGAGPGSIRFWESLQAGAIPVLFDRDIAYPPHVDWSKCVVYIPRNQLKNISTILGNIPRAQEKQLRASCLKAHQECAGENIIKCIRHYYEN